MYCYSLAGKAGSYVVNIILGVCITCDMSSLHAATRNTYY